MVSRLTPLTLRIAVLAVVIVAEVNPMAETIFETFCKRECRISFQRYSSL